MHNNISGHLDCLGKMSGNDILDREVIVWLPTDYLKYPAKRFPVLYMHDGQNLFDPSTSFLGVDWQVDETIEFLSKNKLISPPIVVGMYNTPGRLKDYNDPGLGRYYLDFIVNNVKPLIDELYRTLAERKHTSVMGSSMGGLISFLAVWHYPEIFSQAACLSPMFWGKKFVNVNAWQVVERNPQHPLDAKIYLDNGTVGSERRLMPGCLRMLNILEQKGYQQNKNLLWFVDKGAEHNENAWAARLWRPLQFMDSI